MTPNIRHVILDIEGTIAPISFVHDVMFPFARRRLSDYLKTTWDEPAVCAARDRISADANHAEFAFDELIAHLTSLMDRDAKTTGLKLLQGLIWESGFQSGELVAPLYDDVAPAIRAWARTGISTSIYSSGSAQAQRLFLAHSNAGDLTPLIRGYFDTTVGPKQSAESYRNICRTLECEPATALFISDISGELDAAATACLQTRLAVRPGNAPVAETSHATIRLLAKIRLTPPQQP